ncbi:hypothetical protein SRABI106_02301 [Rahnella aquatilis]|nr:hypothetical protein SRABI106_02301 [Rahnella aquatilis]
MPGKSCQRANHLCFPQSFFDVRESRNEPADIRAFRNLSGG